MSSPSTGRPIPKRRESEPADDSRGPSPLNKGSAYEVVERGPAAPGSPERVIDDPDGELVDRWQGGDEDAFEELVRRHQQRVFRLLMRMLGNREEAEDVTQEALLSLHRHGRRFRSEARFSTFVYRVAANAALNRRRSLGRARARRQKLAERHQAGDNLPEAPRNPEDVAQAGQVAVQVRRALETLAPPLRMPLVLYDLEGLSYGEIAKVMSVAEGTVKSRIHRARLALREQLRDTLHGVHEERES